MPLQKTTACIRTVATNGVASDTKVAVILLTENPHTPAARRLDHAPELETKDRIELSAEPVCGWSYAGASGAKSPKKRADRRPGNLGQRCGDAGFLTELEFESRPLVAAALALRTLLSGGGEALVGGFAGEVLCRIALWY